MSKPEPNPFKKEKTDEPPKTPPPSDRVNDPK